MRLAALRGVSVPRLSLLSERLGSSHSDAYRQQRRPTALKQRLPRTRRRTEWNTSQRQLLVACNMSARPMHSCAQSHDGQQSRRLRNAINLNLCRADFAIESNGCEWRKARDEKGNHRGTRGGKTAIVTGGAMGVGEATGGASSPRART